jgi:hypothetical protein
MKIKSADSSKALVTIPEDSSLQIKISSLHASIMQNDLSLQTAAVQHGVHLQGNGSVAMNSELCTLHYVFPVSAYLIDCYYSIYLQ